MSQQSRWRSREFWHTSAIVVVFSFLVAYTLMSAGIKGQQPSLIGVSILFTVFGLLQAGFAMGYKRALVFFGLCTVLSWLAESHSIASGNVGAYYYTPVLGFKLGQVPAVIPLSWFMMMYPSYVIANLVIDQKPYAEKSTIGRALWLSAVSAIVLTAWDLSLDPYMAGVVKAWIWVDGGPYFGVPLANYFGWLQVTFGINLLYRLIERTIPLKPVANDVKWWITALPVAIYALNWLSYLAIGEPPAARLIAVFAMGIPVLMASAQLRLLRARTLEEASS